jgi:hypothetical protein
MTQDFRDFLNQLDARGMNYAAPVPALPGAINTCFHEYELVRQQSNSEKFPRLNLSTYLRLLDGDIRRTVDEQTRHAQEDIVRKSVEIFKRSGALAADRRRDLGARLAARLSPAYVGRKIVKTLSRRFPDYNSALWRGLRAIGIEPFAVRQRVTEWPDVAQALDFAMREPLRSCRARSELEYRVPARLIELVK